MSGLYLLVWDDFKPFNRVLKATKGGWPHITVAYTGKNVSVSALKEFSTAMMDTWLMRKVTIEQAYVNSFQYDSGEWRHDCLLRVDAETTADVEVTRKVLRTAFENADTFSMHDPHVTVGIHSSVENAQQQVDQVNRLLPITVTVTGVAID